MNVFLSMKFVWQLFLVLDCNFINNNNSVSNCVNVKIFCSFVQKTETKKNYDSTNKSLWIFLSSFYSKSFFVVKNFLHQNKENSFQRLAWNLTENSFCCFFKHVMFFRSWFLFQKVIKLFSKTSPSPRKHFADESKSYNFFN